jgi:hypothetical protein
MKTYHTQIKMKYHRYHPREVHKRKMIPQIERIAQKRWEPKGRSLTEMEEEVNSLIAMRAFCANTPYALTDVDIKRKYYEDFCVQINVIVSVKFEAFEIIKLITEVKNHQSTTSAIFKNYTELIMYYLSRGGDPKEVIIKLQI